ncbi:hypothetical protein ACFL2K_01915 [Candidatus Margulisiibacteriota bacterium]
MQTEENTINFNPNNRYVYHLFDKVKGGEFSFLHNDLSGIDDWFLEKAEKCIENTTAIDPDLVDFTHAGLFWYFHKQELEQGKNMKPYKLSAKKTLEIIQNFVSFCGFELLKRRGLIPNTDISQIDLFNPKHDFFKKPTKREISSQTHKCFQATGDEAWYKLRDNLKN